jgi:hypothetical protein
LILRLKVLTRSHESLEKLNQQEKYDPNHLGQLLLSTPRRPSSINEHGPTIWAFPRR